MALAVEKDVSFDPADISLLGAQAVVPDPNARHYLVQQSWRGAASIAATG